MQGLPGIRIAHGSFYGCGRSPAAKQDLLLLGFQQTSSSLKFCRKGFSPALPLLKASLQVGAATENAETSLGEVFKNQKEGEVKNDEVTSESFSGSRIEENVTNDGVALEGVSGSQLQEKAMNDDVALEEGPQVKVKFVLEKKCNFGQRFNVVGNDPLFGDWEVEAAIPMQWADGDIWTVEVDVPAEKQFEFKFVLTGESGEVEWQPGSNRVLTTVGDTSPLVVSEAWNSVDEAAVVEAGEDLVSHSITDSETDGTQVIAEIFGMENEAKDKVIKAMEYTDNGTDAHSSTLTESDADAAPEVPVVELDVATTVVESVVGVNDTA